MANKLREEYTKQTGKPIPVIMDDNEVRYISIDWADWLENKLSQSEAEITKLKNGS